MLNVCVERAECVECEVCSVCSVCELPNWLLFSKKTKTQNTTLQ